MAQPAMKSFAAQLYASLGRLTEQDASLAWPLAHYANGIGEMFQVVEDYGRDQGDDPGWSQLVDINRAPYSALPWLAQFVGVRTQDGLTDAQQRARILGVGGWNRGTLQSIAAAAAQYLTGTKTVVIRERDAAISPANPAYGLTVITRKSETPVADWATTNLLSNPSFETNTTGWNGNVSVGATLNDFSQSAFWSLDGSKSAHMKWTQPNDTTVRGGEVGSIGGLSGIPVTGSTPYTFSGYIHVIDPPGIEQYATIYWYKNTGADSTIKPYSSSVATTNHEGRISVSDTSPSDAAFAAVALGVDTNVPNDIMEFYVDAMQFEQAELATPYVGTSRPAGQGPVGQSILSQKPAGILLNFQTLTGTDYQGLLDLYSTYGVIFSTFTTYEGVLDLNPGH